MATTIRIPEEFYRRLKLKDNLRWGSGKRVGEWKRRHDQTPRRRVR